MTGWVWRFPPNTQPPHGLKMVQDKPHHYCISPTRNMTVDKFKGLLEEMALKASRVFKKEGKVCMSQFKLELAGSELKYVLEGLIALEQEMAKICETSDDLDEVADVGNDLIELRLLLNPLKERAISQFGDSITDFSRDEL